MLPKFVRVSRKLKNHLFPAVQKIAGEKVKVIEEVETPKGTAYRVEVPDYGATQILANFCDPCDSSGRSVTII